MAESSFNRRRKTTGKEICREVGRHGKDLVGFASCEMERFSVGCTGEIFVASLSDSMASLCVAAFSRSHKIVEDVTGR